MKKLMTILMSGMLCFSTSFAAVYAEEPETVSTETGDTVQTEEPGEAESTPENTKELNSETDQLEETAEETVQISDGKEIPEETPVSDSEINAGTEESEPEVSEEPDALITEEELATEEPADDEPAEENNLLPVPVQLIEGYVFSKTAESEETEEEIIEIDEEAVLLAASDMTYEQAKKAYADAQKKVTAAQAEIDKGSLGFFNSNAGSENNMAADVFNYVFEMQEEGINKGMKYQGKEFEFKEHMYTNLGAEHDATNLNNVRRAIELLKELNEIRGIEGLNPLKVTDQMMAISEVQANIEYGLSVDYGMLTHNKGIISKYGVGENLASFDEGVTRPFDGWYYDEKAVAEYMEEHGITNPNEAYERLHNEGFDFKGYYITSTGHYRQIIKESYITTGMGVRANNNEDPDTRFLPDVATNNFSSWYDEENETAYTLEEYEQLFNNYYNRLTSNLKNAKKEATAAKAVLDSFAGITISKTSAELKKGGVLNLSATVKPSDLADKKVIWSSSNANVATVDSNGKVTAKTGGTATITATHTASGKKVSCKVTVTVPVSSVKLNKTSLFLEKGKTTTLTATVSPSDASNKKITWTSSNTKVASVDQNGKVTAKAAGNATITVKTADGNKTAACKVTVKEAKPSPTKEPASCKTFGFCRISGKDYWYENGVRQAMPGDPKNLIDVKYHTERGREIFDPKTNAWYWLDSVYNGAKAAGKEVWMPYIYQDEANWKDNAEMMNNVVNRSNTYTEKNGPVSDMGEQVRKAIQNKDGKWVRYDENGKMMKGWVTITGELAKAYPNQKGHTYFYDYQTGLMAKGWTTIGGTRYFFDETSGVLRN